MEFRRLEHDLRGDEIIPNTDEHDDQVSTDHGPNDWEDDLEEDADFTATIDPG